MPKDSILKASHPSLAKLQDYEDKIVVFKETMKANYMWVIKSSMDGNLLSHLILLMRFD